MGRPPLLSAADLEESRRRVAAGEPLTSIAADRGVSVRTLRSWLNQGGPPKSGAAPRRPSPPARRPAPVLGRSHAQLIDELDRTREMAEALDALLELGRHEAARGALGVLIVILAEAARDLELMGGDWRQIGDVAAAITSRRAPAAEG